MNSNTSKISMIIKGKKNKHKIAPHYKNWKYQNDIKDECNFEKTSFATNNLETDFKNNSDIVSYTTRKKNIIQFL